jgi:hypothetical protein
MNLDAIYVYDHEYTRNINAVLQSMDRKSIRSKLEGFVTRFDQDKFNKMIIQEEEVYYLQGINQEGKDDLP